jgi:polar amino acid transport system permease protein
MSNFKWDVFLDAFPFIIKGLWITLSLTILCFLFALVSGFLWTFLRRIPIKPIQWIVVWTMEFIRSTPPLVQLFFIYYALPVAPVVGDALTFSPYVSAVLGLGIHFSTYISEVYRSGIEGVEQGQWEASRALNFTTGQKWTKIILPQAIPPTIPMLGNYLIIMFKEVPLASTIGVMGILHLANNYGAKNWDYVEPLTIVALLFLLLSYPSAVLINKLEKKLNRNFDKNAILKESS